MCGSLNLTQNAPPSFISKRACKIRKLKHSRRLNYKLHTTPYAKRRGFHFLTLLRWARESKYLRSMCEWRWWSINKIACGRVRDEKIYECPTWFSWPREQRAVGIIKWFCYVKLLHEGTSLKKKMQNFKNKKLSNLLRSRNLQII